MARSNAIGVPMREAVGRENQPNAATRYQNRTYRYTPPVRSIRKPILVANETIFPLSFFQSMGIKRGRAIFLP